MTRTAFQLRERRDICCAAALDWGFHYLSMSDDNYYSSYIEEPAIEEQAMHEMKKRVRYAERHETPSRGGLAI